MLPGFDPRPWGTQDLSPIYPNHKFSEKIGEAWLSGDDCKVATGPLAGKTLAQLSEQHQRELVGEAARDPKRRCGATPGCSSAAKACPQASAAQ